MPIPTSLEEIERRHRALSDQMAEERRKEGHDGGTTAYFNDLLELRLELVDSTRCLASELIKYCRRVTTGDPDDAIGCAVQILIEATERNWNRTRESSLAEIAKALAGSFGVEAVRDAIDIVEVERGKAASGQEVPPWSRK